MSWGEAHRDIQNAEIKFNVSSSFHFSLKVVKLHAGAHCWSVKKKVCALLLNLLFSRQDLSVCPLYHTAM